jgi:hypothetical protein
MGRDLKKAVAASRRLQRLQVRGLPRLVKRNVKGKWSHRSGRIERAPCLRMSRTRIYDDHADACGPGLGYGLLGLRGLEMAIDLDAGFYYRKQ